MKKKGIWALIAVVFIYIVFDFVTDKQDEQAAIKKAEERTEQVAQNTTPATPEPQEPQEPIESSDLPEEGEELSEEEFNALMEEFYEQQTGENNEDQGSGIEFGANPGNYAYDFYLEDMDGNYVSLSDFRGKKVFLNFWASWCPPCKVEAPHLKEFAESQEDVVVLGVNVTSSESDLANVAGFIEEYDLNFPNLYGNDEIFYMYYVESLPTSYFIDSNGIISERVVGPVTTDILEARFAMMD